jgi:hypothetical protein
VALQNIGSVKGGKSKRSFQVYWNDGDQKVYVEVAGRVEAGKAPDVGSAMNKAKAFVVEK